MTKKTEKTPQQNEIDVLKLGFKNQSEALKKALSEERSQFGMYNRLKQINRDFESFTLSEFQRTICENINIFFVPLTSLYSVNQKRKAEQVQRLKDGKEPLINISFNVIYENNDIIFTKTYQSEEKAKEAKKALSLKNIRIERTESEVSTAFNPMEALRILHKAEIKYNETFTENRGTLTLPMLKRSLSLNVTKQDKNNTKKTKFKIAV